MTMKNSVLKGLMCSDALLLLCEHHGLLCYRFCFSPLRKTDEREKLSYRTRSIAGIPNAIGLDLRHVIGRDGNLVQRRA